MIGIISLLVLAAAIYARYKGHLLAFWRPTYVVTAVIALYLNFFVLIVQSFLKVPAFKALAPTQSEPPFRITHLVGARGVPRPWCLRRDQISRNRRKQNDRSQFPGLPAPGNSFTIWSNRA